MFEASRIIGGPVGLDEPLLSTGLGSIEAVELSIAISAATGVRVGSTLLFDFPTVAEIVKHVLANGIAESPSPGKQRLKSSGSSRIANCQIVCTSNPF